MSRRNFFAACVAALFTPRRKRRRCRYVFRGGEVFPPPLAAAGLHPGRKVAGPPREARRG